MLNIPDSEWQEIADEMIAQDNRMTQYPIFEVRDTGDENVRIKFLTNKRAEEHLQIFRYRFINPYVYVACEKSHDIILYMKIVLEFRTDKEKPIPSHYL